jgi:hypothetical protein
LGFGDQIAKPGDEKIPILIIPKYLTPLNPPGHDVVYRSWSVNSGFSRHTALIADFLSEANIKI